MSLLKRAGLLILILAIFAPVSVSAFEVPEGVQVLTAPEVRDMVDRDQALFVHTLSRIEYQMQHIPGSINIPVNELESSPKMPADKNAAIIFYCNGLACPYSRRAATAAVKLGYTQVYWFRGGILEWRKFQYRMEVSSELSEIKVVKLSPFEFRETAKNNDALILDVRPHWWRQSALKSGVIEGTEMMIPLLELDKQLDLLPMNRPIMLVDRLMRQSAHAAKYLKTKGFNVLGILKGGAKHWVAEELPVLQKQDEPGTVMIH